MATNNKLTLPDQRMLALMEHAIREGLAATEAEYLAKISFPRTNISNIRRGHQSFTRDHILNACAFTGANANWIFGFERNMMRKPGKDPIQQMREALVAIEQDRKAGKKG